MEINILQLLIKNKFRQYVRVFKKNKFECLMGAFAGVFLILSGVDLMKIGVTKHFQILSLIFFVYCISKVFQDIPIMNIDYRLFEFKILNPWKLKMIIILKSIILSSIIFILAIFNIADEKAFHQVIVLMLINIVINFICFLKSQTKHTDILTAGTLLVAALAYYLNSIALIAIYLLIVIYIFICKKYFKYDELLSYYHSMAFLQQGLVNNSMDDVSQGQVQLTNQRVKSPFNFMEKYYSKGSWFEFYKEISRALYNYKKIIKASLIVFLITFLMLMYGHPMWINGISMFCLVVISDSVLTLLNKTEAVNVSKGFYYPYSLTDIIKHKYFAHLCIILVPFLSGLLIIKYVSFIALLICFLILPLKNILHNFSSKITAKCSVFCLESIIAFACFINAI